MSHLTAVGSAPWAELVVVEAKIKRATAELKAIVLARGSRLMDLHGIGPVVAARILADIGDVTRFADRNRFASWTGTAPLDASSGEQHRHRLSRAGNCRMNHMIHIAALSQIRLDTDDRAYYRRKRAEAKKSLEAIRCKRRISDAIYRHLLADARLTPGTGPGGHCRANQESSAVDLPPHIDTSDHYTAPSEAAAKERFNEFTDQWGARYPAIVQLWENAWTEFVPFLEYDVEIRKVIFTTNAIESINARYRRGSGPPATSRPRRRR